jgi:trk system potassium uptake protein TrkH
VVKVKNSLNLLSYAVRIPVICKYTAQILLLLSILTLAPFIVSVITADYVIALHYLTVIILLFLISVPLSRISTPAHIQTNEALVIVALAFIFSSLIMIYPLMASGLSFTDALFEAVSGVTTTGLTTVTGLQDQSVAFLFARAWMQWTGGLGIVVLSIALLMGHHIAAHQLAGPLSSETMATTARTHARRMLIIYVAITLIALVILWFLTGNGLNALLHVLAAVSTGGFAPDDASLAAFESLQVRYVIILIAFCGAIPLPLYYLAWRMHVKAFFTDVEFRGLLLLTVSVCVLLVTFLHLRSGFSLQDSFIHGILLGISAQTTTGFSSLDIVSLDDSSKIVTILAMLVGGGMGSSAGGIKVLRLLILLRLIQLLIRSTALSSHAVVNARLGNKPLGADDMQRAMLLITLFVMVILVSWLIFVFYGYPPLDALFEIVSATATVGLTTGITDTDLPATLKALLCIDMLIGRVEIVALLIVLYPPTWFGKRAQF